LSTGHSVAIGTAQKVEIWHSQTKDEIVDELTTRAKAVANSRVAIIWPDTVGTDGEGYFLAAALAGYGRMPHQGLSNAEITGFTDLSRTAPFFTPGQVNKLSANGVWVVNKDVDGVVYSHRAVNTDPSSLNTLEEGVRFNLDAIAYYLYRSVKQFIGSTNVTEDTLTAMRVHLEAALEFLKTETLTSTLGSMLTDSTITGLRQHATLKDRVVVNVSVTVPYPTNVIELTVVA
jgi:hypothetical protein